jgi:hypothetical protein
MGEANKPKTDRKFVVLRLLPRERDLIRQLGCGPEKDCGLDNRDAVLRQIVQTVKKLTLPAIEKRRPLRFSMPDKLARELKKRSAKSGRTQLDILIAAIEEFRKEHPYEEQATPKPSAARNEDR